ncbi:MAG: ADP-forming succinate--CoA ligase subunit beta [Bacillota bacterium]|jgi:succinyl-CoA synthetase beta subunit
MKIHEYQAQALMREYGINVPDGYLALNAEEAVSAAEKIDGSVYVLKAQIHSGGRGKAGGVKIAKNLDEVKEYAAELIGKRLFTKQAGPEGKVVHKILVTGGADIKQEYYFSMTVDNENAGLVMIASADGGTEIEETAEKHPEKIAKENVSLMNGIRNYQIKNVAAVLGFEGDLYKEFAAMVKGMYKMFVEKDCSLVEINPLILTGEGHLEAIDAKINFDDNALYRHPEIEELRDEAEEDPKEVKAKKYDLNYIALDGHIGCMVNGAGLAMATMDIINYYGGKAANFLDVGGSATEENITEAFKILLSDPNVKGILVNIFGGIMRCDVIAQGIVAAAKVTNIQVPVVVRLNGTNVEQSRVILAESGLNLISEDDLSEAVKKCIACAGGVK